MSGESTDIDRSDQQKKRNDVIYDILSDHRRRLLLRCLQKFDDTITLADVADEVAVRECNAHIAEIPAETVMEIYLSLYHTHIPKLEAANFVEYDQEGDLVTAKHIDIVSPYLEVVDDQDN